ncbi:MAG: hypothetical protein EHM21_08290 [Chloroflexi bacterium]|nr:MAG: hypothetical protein EHM21_08290 [Chloroflexota bacterium]
MNHIKHHILKIGLLLLLLLSACALRTRVPVSAPVAPPTPTKLNVVLPTPETPAAQDPSAAPTAAPQASPTRIPTATAPVIPDQPAAITAEGVNLRAGPGTLFGRLGQLGDGAMVTVTGKAPGDDWIYIDTGDRQGWVSVAFTSMAEPGKLATVPVLETGDAQVIQGRVTQSDGMPLAGIEFAAFQGSGDNPPDTRAHSLADGSFYLYLPADAQGAWRVSLTAVDCQSPIVDDNCNFTGAFMPRFTDVELPAEKVVEFQYMK